MISCVEIRSRFDEIKKLSTMTEVLQKLSSKKGKKTGANIYYAG